VGGLLGGFRVEPPLQPFALVGREPRSLGGSVAQHRSTEAGENDRGDALDDEHPLPARDAEPAFEFEQMRRQRRADHAGEGATGVEDAHHPAAIAGGEPAGHEVGDAREEPGLGDAEQEARDHEAGLAGDQRGAGGTNPPHRHDDGDPGPRAELGQDQVGGELEQHVAPEERTRAQAIGGSRQAERLVHGQRRDRDVEAVERVDEIAEAEKGDQPPCDLAHDRGFEFRGHRFLRLGRARAALPACNRRV
jgi:hypothetical protein